MMPDNAGFVRLDVAAMLATPPPAPDWILDGFIERGETVWIAGAGKAGKSLLATFLAAACLRGGQFLGRDVARLDRVVVLDCENRAATIHRRLHHLGGDLAGLDYYQLRSADLGGEAGLAALRSVARGAGLVVLDSLVGLHSIDEDSAMEVRRFVLGLRAVAEDTGAAIIGLAHENRQGNLRGSLDWRNAVDATIELKKEGSWRTLTVADRRDGGDDAPPVKFRFALHEGRLLIEGRVPGRREVMASQIEAVLAEDPNISQVELARQLGTTRDNDTFRQARKAARPPQPTPARATPPVPLRERGGGLSPESGSPPPGDGGDS
jgi:hypothetical protein